MDVTSHAYTAVTVTLVDVYILVPLYNYNITSLVLSPHRLTHNSTNPTSPLTSPLYKVRLEYCVVYRIYSALLNRL